MSQHREIIARPPAGYLPAVIVGALASFDLWNFVLFSPLVGLPCLTVALFIGVGLFLRSTTTKNLSPFKVNPPWAIAQAWRGNRESA